MSTEENIKYVKALCIETGWSGVPDEWCDIVADCHREMLATGIEFSVDQIKEKFGGLRLYYSCKRDSVDYELLDEIIRKAEESVWNLEKEKGNEE